MGLKKREKPCEVCGWIYPGFHICIDTSAPAVQTKAPPKAKKGYTFERPKKEITPEERERLQKNVQVRWEKHRKAMAGRDAKIVARYKEGLGLKKIANEFGTTYQTTRKVVQRAAERGEVVMRPIGTNDRFRKESV